MGLIHDCTPKATNAVSDLGLSWWATAPTGAKSLFTHPRRRHDSRKVVRYHVRNKRSLNVNKERLLVIC
jgi:hypothetical protein